MAGSAPITVKPMAHQNVRSKPVASLVAVSGPVSCSGVHVYLLAYGPRP